MYTTSLEVFGRYRKSSVRQRKAKDFLNQPGQQPRIKTLINNKTTKTKKKIENKSKQITSSHFESTPMEVLDSILKTKQDNSSGDSHVGKVLRTIRLEFKFQMETWTRSGTT